MAVPLYFTKDNTLQTMPNAFVNFGANYKLLPNCSSIANLTRISLCTVNVQHSFRVFQEFIANFVPKASYHSEFESM